MVKTQYVLQFVAGIIIIWLTACATQEETTERKQPNTDTATTLTIAPGPLSPAMDAYYKLKDAFVKSEGTTADMTAMQLRLIVDTLNAKNLKVDSSYNPAIVKYREAVLHSIDGLIKERDIQAKRSQFKAISDTLYRMVTTLPYSGQTVYHIHCPMAFKTGAYWLNNTPEVTNPYYGSEMLTCGSVADSIAGK